MSAVFGICMVKNAEDIIGPVVQNMMDQVDHVIVADNLSTDNTRTILDSLTGNITIVDDTDPAYEQSRKMTTLAHLARSQGAEWVVPFDADEWWFVPSGGRIADVMREHNYCVYEAPMFDHVPTGVDDISIINPIHRIGYRRSDFTPFSKVACRATRDLVIEMGNHSATYEAHMPTYSKDYLQVRHFPYRDARQFIEKVITGNAALSLADLRYDQGQHWRDYAKLYESGGESVLTEVFNTWFYTKNPEDMGLVYDPIIP